MSAKTTYEKCEQMAAEHNASFHDHESHVLEEAERG